MIVYEVIVRLDEFVMVFMGVIVDVFWFVLDVCVVGGLQMLDDGEADDKIIAVLVGDPVWDGARELTDLPPLVIERLQHYFSTYKLHIGEKSTTSIRDVYGYERAAQVVIAAIADYNEVYPDPLIKPLGGA